MSIWYEAVLLPMRYLRSRLDACVVQDIPEVSDDMSEDDRLRQQVAKLQAQLAVALKSKVCNITTVCGGHQLNAVSTPQISTTKSVHLQRQAFSAEKRQMKEEMASMRQLLDETRLSHDSMKQERKALLHYAQALEADVARVGAGPAHASRS